MATIIDTLKSLIGGREGIIGIRTYEADRVIATLWKIASDPNNGMELLTWSCTDGVRKVTLVDQQVGDNVLQMRGYAAIPQSDMSGPEGQYRNPPGPMMAARNYKPNDVDTTVVVVAQNMHHWFKDRDVQQYILDCAYQFLGKRRNIIMVGPIMEMPVELIKAVTVIDWPMPTPEEIRAQVVGYINTVNASGDYKQIQIAEDEVQTIVRLLQGQNETEIKHSLNMVLTTMRTISASQEAIDILRERKTQAVRATRALEYIKTDITTSHIGGLRGLKQYIREVKPVYSDEAKAYGAVPPTGVLLVGPPGTGKSLTAKAIANEFELPLLRVDVGALFGNLVGESEATLRMALKQAEAAAPCILWFDEVDRGLGGGGGELDGGTSQRVFGTLLTWTQEVARPKGIFVFMTSNSAHRIEAPLMQRVDQFYVGLPKKEARMDIFAIHLSLNGRGNYEELGLNLEALADATEAFSPREIENAVLAAIRKSFLARRDGTHDGDLTQDFLLKAIRRIAPVSLTMAAELAEMDRWAVNAIDADKLYDEDEPMGRVVVSADLLPD